MTKYSRSQTQNFVVFLAEGPAVVLAVVLAVFFFVVPAVVLAVFFFVCQSSLSVDSVWRTEKFKKRLAGEKDDD